MEFAKSLGELRGAATQCGCLFVFFSPHNWLPTMRILLLMAIKKSHRIVGNGGDADNNNSRQI